MKVLLTVGHSILKSGACTSADGRPYGGVLEYAYNKDIVNQVAEHLRTAGHTADVLICPELTFARSTDEKAYKLNAANNGDYDLVVELHLNASALHNAQGSEVLYISEKGKEVAKRIQAQLATAFKSRGIQKRTGLYMLNSTKPVTVMLETFFCDSSDDCMIAEHTNVPLLIAQGIHGGVIQAQETESSGFLYRVQVGAYRNKANAERAKADLIGKGYSAFITTVDVDGILYRVQVGAYSVKSNADAMKQRLQAAGFSAIIVKA